MALNMPAPANAKASSHAMALAMGISKDRHGWLRSIGRADEARASCDNDQRRKAMNAEGGCSASARSKDYRRIAQSDEARHEQEFAKQARRPLAMSRETSGLTRCLARPAPASHPVKPVDCNGELGI